MKNRVIVITDASDGHLQYVQKYLDDELLVVDPLQVTSGKALSFGFENGSATVASNGKNLKNVGAVWYRKPVDFRDVRLPVPSKYHDYSLSSLSRHAALLRTAFTDARWVSDYYAMLRAENKTLQYRIAAAEGLSVPDTLITSDEKAALSFIRDHSPVIVKSLSIYSPDGTVFPTTLIDKGRPFDLKGLKLAPAMFQKAIDPSIELRVTVIGRKVFAAGIVDKPDGDFPAMRDWRYGNVRGKTNFVTYDRFTKKLENACRTIVQKLGLQFGAIDLIIDKKGAVWFLEINPNGQWAFIEIETGLPLGKAVADLLTGAAPKL